MIKDSNRVDSATISKYREINLDDVLREFLLLKGTWKRCWDTNETEPSNKIIEIKNPDLITSCLWLYGFKSNPTNKMNCAYYLEKQARQRCMIIKGAIEIPKEIWESCDKELKEFVRGRKL